VLAGMVNISDLHTQFTSVIGMAILYGGGSRRGHVLAGFSKLEKEAIEVKVEPLEAKPNAYAEAPIIEIKCKYCGYRWKQYLTPFFNLSFPKRLNFISPIC